MISILYVWSVPLFLNNGKVNKNIQPEHNKRSYQSKKKKKIPPRTRHICAANSQTVLETYFTAGGALQLVENSIENIKPKW